MTKILLTRHGHVEGIKPERFRGREPLELTERGRAEAQRRRPTHRRHLATEQDLLQSAGPLRGNGAGYRQGLRLDAEVCDDLNDIDYGAWQFKTFEAAKAKIRNCLPPGSPRRT